MTHSQRTRGKPRRPVRFNGTDYHSLTAARRATGHDMNWKLAKGKAEALPAPDVSRLLAPGAVGAARRILAVAAEIAELATIGAEGDRYTRVELTRRRLGLLKALWRFRQQYGAGVEEVAE